MATSFTFDPARGFGVYVHWPYCARICPYCDFNVYAAKARDSAPLLKAIAADLAGWRMRSGARRVDSLFFGGGTPSLLRGSEIAALIETVDKLWGLADDAEITLEANPDNIESSQSQRVSEFAAAGVNRMSLGMQSLRDANLKFLGRTHDARAAVAAFDAARPHFTSVSLDLIYALPEQNMEAWAEELSDVLAMQPDHLSLYELTIEPGAAFARAVRRGVWTPADEERAATLYELTQQMAGAAGLPAYEVSNHARAPEHRARHNTVYWRSGDWVGVGPGAHGRLTADGGRWAVEAARTPADYIRRVEADGLGWSSSEPLDALAQARERVAMGLRMADGMALTDLTQLGLSSNESQIADLTDEGLMQRQGDMIALTAAGRLLADRIAEQISP